jgi:hypothetical protein
MSFESFKSIADVIVEYQITSTEKSFIQPLPIEIDSGFQEMLNLHLTEFNVKDSEYATCEMIIFPILAKVYYQHRQKFVLWSHKTLTYDDRLTGIPDYTLANRSPLGKVIWEKPYFVAVEAKKDDFIKGWGQCLAQMLAMQKLNEKPQQSVYGIVTNGEIWQFGNLLGQTFTQERRSYTIDDLETLMAALNFLFQSCGEFV